MICIVESEEKLLDLIADLSKYGLHSPNPFSKADEDGLAASDRFDRLLPSCAEEYLGVRDYEWQELEVIDGNGKEWIEEPCCDDMVALNRETLHFDSDLCKLIKIPKENDYPILINWEFEDSFDRVGSIELRIFNWESLKKIPNSHDKTGKTIVRSKYELWTKKYGKMWDEINNRVGE